MGVIVVEFGFDDTDHHGLADLEGPGGEHAFTPGISALELVAAAHVACSLGAPAFSGQIPIMPHLNQEFQ
jgi:hypothetical protein